MKKQEVMLNQRCGAFTATDVLIVVATVAVLGGLAYSGFRPWRRPACHIGTTCRDRVMQLSTAFLVWANDHDDKLPMSASTNAGGALEFAGSAGPSLYFQLMSNEVHNPNLLTCPTDKNRPRATNIACFTDANISYFVNLDTDETRPQTILLGDRNISTNGQLMSGILRWPAAGPVRWTADLHKHVGNLGMADGSSQQSTDSSLSNAFAKLTATTTKSMRFSIP